MTIEYLQAMILTWLDVERRLKEGTAGFTEFNYGISNIQCFADGAEIEYVGKNNEQAKIWLRQIFVGSISDDCNHVILQIGLVPYPIAYIEVPEARDSLPYTYPLWRDQAYAKNDSLNTFPRQLEVESKIVAFHSFKGGVGRTSALMTYAAAQLNVGKNKPVRILLIDADLEAPGISFWLGDQSPPTVSFINLLEALHYPPVDTETTLNYFTAELRKTSLNVGGSNREVFILPAALSMHEIMDMPVQPEHIARNPSNPWILTDHLLALGHKLEVDRVFVDLRAGLSELASPLLFDPRVEHFFVTTVAPQSTAGMGEILNQLYRYQNNLPDEAKSLAKPSVIISLLTQQLKQLPVFTQAAERLNQAYPAPFDDSLSSGFEWLEVEFNESLMSIASVKDALEVLTKSSLYPMAETWAGDLVLQENERYEKFNAEKQQTPVNKTPVNKLFDTCQSFQFAEKTDTDDMLITDPLRNLAKHYTDELPNVVSVGAKGAGKTFTYIQICRTLSWCGFLQKLGQEGTKVGEGTIYPLLVSTNIDGGARDVVESARQKCVETLNYHNSISSSSLTNQIKAALSEKNSNWDELLERLIAKEFSAQFESLENLNDDLNQKNKSIVLVIDGIEDLFDEPENNEDHKRAIKAILQLPNRLNELKNRRIGLVCFARADYVQIAIRQNLAQYLSRFQAFKLEWTPETFLRLAYWLCGKAGVIDAQPELAETFSTDELLTNLKPLWGNKLGRDGSKEANTARWIFAALSDLNGKLQARDLVRFLKFAANQMKNIRTGNWPDRLLYPEAIRKSLVECSQEKVTEAALEINALKRWQDLLKEIQPDELKVPFNATAVGLDTDMLTALKVLGIIYEDTDRISEPNRLYLPEIYRTGLGFQSSVGGRPRVQALLKRNLGGLPF